MASNLLSDRVLNTTKADGKTRILNDGDGLRVVFHVNGSKYFQLRYTIHGKEKSTQLGTYPVMTLAKARTAALEMRRMIKAGTDPVVDKKIRKAEGAADAAATFRTIATEWLVSKNNLSASTRKYIEATFSANVYPRIGDLPIGVITPPLVLTTLRVIEARGALELLGKCRRWLGQVFDYARATGKLKGDNPAHCLVDVLKKGKSENYPTFKGSKDHGRKDAGEFLRRLAEYSGGPITSIAVWLQMMIATRPGELRKAEWTEFDLDAAEWRFHVTKTDTTQIITLSQQAIKALKELHEFTGHSRYLFPGRDPLKPISDGTINKLLRTLWPEYRIVAHGFRHFFSTMANEHGHFRPDVIEAALSHKDKNAIRAVYNKATYLDERRKLAQWWADELEAMRDGGKVIKFNAGTS